MAIGTWSSDAERKLIQQMNTHGKTVVEISKLLKCSRYKIYNALEHIKQHGTTKNVKQHPISRKTTPRKDSLIYKAAVKDPFTSSSKIKNEISSDFGINISSRTIRRRLNEKNLRGCIAQRKPLVSKKILNPDYRFQKNISINR